MRQFPGQKARIDAAFSATLETIPESPARAAGIALGKKMAASVFADRQNDATNVPDTYRPLTQPGVWVPTTPPLFPQYATAKPWGLTAANQFRPGPPPALSSALYTRDYNETKDLGGVKSLKRTDAQSDAVRFWTQSNLGPAWFQAATQVSARKGLGLAENARLFALMSMGLANCFIVDWDAKFHYNFWRPVTAIRNGDQDGNDATERDAGWVPLNATPMHPEYPSQAGINAGAARAVLEFGLRDRTCKLYRDRHRRRAPVAPIHQLQADGRRAQGGARLGRHSLPQFARRGQVNGRQDR